MNVYFFTLGCKVNQYETAALSKQFADDGFTLCDSVDDADVCVVNSCTVTASGDQKSLRCLRRAKKRGCVTVLCGCYAQVYTETAQNVEADIIVGTRGKNSIVAHVRDFLQNREQIIDVTAHEKGERFEIMPLDDMTSRTRAFIKIEDGCNRFCSYCIVPYARGPVRSMPLAELAKQASVISAAGYKEVVLTGINLCFYGAEFAMTLADAVDLVAAEPGIARVRLSSVEPDMLDTLTLKRLACNKKLCPQFHMSLQSGCDETLRRMGRRYTSADFVKTANLIKELFDEPTFTTDIIVGFPGETEEEFSQTLEFVRKFGFLKCHIFPYSRRPGTKAAELSQQCDEATKKSRAARLAEVAEVSRDGILRAQLGKLHTAIAERPDENGRFTGFTERYFPVLIEKSGVKRGDLVTARAEQLVGDCLLLK